MCTDLITVSMLKQLSKELLIKLWISLIHDMLVFMDADTDFADREVAGSALAEEEQVVIGVVEAFLWAQYEHFVRRWFG